jgi:hypothetical protein
LALSPASSIDTAANRTAPRKFSLNVADVGVLKTSGRKHVPQVDHWTCSPSGLPIGKSGMKKKVNHRRMCCST